MAASPVGDPIAIGREARVTTEWRHQPFLSSQRRDQVYASSLSFRPKNNLAAIGREVGKTIIGWVVCQPDGFSARNLSDPQVEIPLATAVGGIGDQLAVRRNDAVGRQARIHRQPSELESRGRFG